MSTPPIPKPRTTLRGALAVTASLLAAAGLISFAPASASAATTTIWGSGTPASVTLSSDPASVELGTSFTPTVSGKATGIRFYKVRGATGKHTGALWTRTGQKLASIAFTNETASGWQVAQLATPVTLTAGQGYVVSYHVPKGGRYGATSHCVLDGNTALPVKSGVFTYGKTVTFPTSTWNSNQYWVDVNFSASGPVPTAPTTPAAPSTSAPAPSASATPVVSTPPSASASPVVSTPPSASAPASSAPAPSGAVFPTRTSVGLPSGWTPKQTVTGNYTISTAGAVVEDLQITNGTIFVNANNVTLRRIKGLGAYVKTYAGSSCSSGLVIEDSTFVKNGTTTDEGTAVIGDGGLTVRRTVIDGLPEGIRAGGGCGPVSVESSYLHIVSPDVCNDWHGDGLQGYGGNKVTVRQSTFVLDELRGCGGTAPFFYPSGQGNTSVDIDGLLVEGGGYAFRNGMPGTVKNLNVVDASWGYGPVDVNCSALSSWQAQTVKLAADGTTTPVRSIACTGVGN